MTPEAKRLLRKERNRERDALRGRVGAGRFQALVRDLAALVRMTFESGATASIFGLEGPLRAGLRADFCLQGWGWLSADLMARDLLAEVFKRIGAERPDWYEGQPEWTIEAGTLIERTRCVRCHKPLTGEQRKYCSRICATSHHNHIARLREADEGAAADLAVNWL
ncbi:hypothetical protein [Paracoccus siganidrum]|nr:hypothetical protein [Paracoccus siganidrum]